MLLNQKTIANRTDNYTDSEVVEIIPSSLVGAAKSQRDIYLRDGTMTENESLYVWNSETGEGDLALGDRTNERPRKRHSRSNSARVKNKARRDKYQKSRDRRKSGKTGVAGQQVTETKVGG